MAGLRSDERWYTVEAQARADAKQRTTYVVRDYADCYRVRDGRLSEGDRVLKVCDPDNRSK